MKILSFVIFIEAAQEACSPKHLADCGAFDDYSSKEDISLSHISVDPDHLRRVASRGSAEGCRASLALLMQRVWAPHMAFNPVCRQSFEFFPPSFSFHWSHDSDSSSDWLVRPQKHTNTF